MNVPLQSPMAGYGALVAWRFAPQTSAQTYAAVVRELAFIRAADKRRVPLPPALAVLADLLSSGGSVPRANSAARQGLVQRYRQLGLDGAAEELQRAALASEGERTGPPRSSPQAYLHTAAEMLELDDTFDRALQASRQQNWAEAQRLWLTAYRGYAGAGGLFELHAADCLLNLSATAAHLEKWPQALAWSANAQAIYERWGRPVPAARAMLNRLGILDRLRRPSPALTLAARCQRLAVRARDLELALDARIAGLALQMQVQPHSAGIKKLAALERFYNGSCTPERKGAYENCALSADAHLEWARARQAVFVFLAGADKASAPPQWDNLKGTLKQVPWAVQTLVEFSPLEIRGTYWPVLLQAVAHVQQWLEAGEFRLPEAANAPALSRQLLESQILLRLLQARTPEPPLLRECRPSSLLVSPPRKLSQDAVERLLALAGRWEEEWMEHPAELMVLGQLYALAAAALVQARRLREAARLFTAAYDCRPDVEMVLIQQVRQGRLPATPLMFKLCLGRAPAEVFPQERAQRRKRVALFLRERQTAAPPR